MRNQAGLIASPPGMLSRPVPRDETSVNSAPSSNRCAQSTIKRLISDGTGYESSRTTTNIADAAVLSTEVSEHSRVRPAWWLLWPGGQCIPAQPQPPARRRSAPAR